MVLNTLKCNDLTPLGLKGLTQYSSSREIHTAIRCKLVVDVDISRVQVRLSADGLLQQQEKCSDASNAVYHSLAHITYIQTVKCVYG